MTQATQEPQSLRLDPVIREPSLRAAATNGFWWAMMFGLGEGAFAQFAAHIQAPEYFFGILAGIPQLFGPFIQWFSANILETYPRRKRMVLTGVLIQSLSFLPMAVLAFFVSSEAHANEWVYLLFMICVLGYFLGGHAGAPPWSSWIGELVPSETRADYFSRLQRGQALLTMIGQLLLGVLLFVKEKISLPALAFMAIFAIAGFCRFMSFCYIRKMYEPKYAPKPETSFTFWQFIRRTRESNFVRFVLFVATLNIALNLSGPFFLPYAIYGLGWEQWQWTVVNSTATLTSILTLLFWGRFSEHYGNKRVMKYTSIAGIFLPVAWLINQDFYYLIVVNACSGIIWSGFNLSTFNYILEAVSAPKRARCVAYFNVIVGCGIFAGSMAGGYLMKNLPLEITAGPLHLLVSHVFQFVLILSALMRLTVCAVFLPGFRELRNLNPKPLKNWFFEIAEDWLPVGLRFAPIESRNAEEKEKDEADEAAAGSRRINGD